MTHGRFSVKFRTGTGRADASLDGNGGICYSLFCCFDERGKNMAVFLHALSAVSIIFLLMAVGYGLSALGWVHAPEKKFISRYVINIGVPANTIAGLLKNLDREEVRQFGRYLLVPLCTILISLAVSVAAAKLLRLPRKQSGVFISLAFLSNTLFIGLPMGLGLFGEISVPYVMIYYMISTIFTQTVIILLIEHAGREPGAAAASLPAGQRIAGFLKDIFLKPPILSIIAAYLLLLLDVRLPDMLMSLAGYLGNTVTPLALMYCGFIVYEIGLRSIRIKKGMPLMLLIRLIIAPAVCFGMCALTGVTGLAKNVFIMQAALPSVTQITVFAGAFGADEKYAAIGGTLTTLGIFITIPVLMVLIS